MRIQKLFLAITALAEIHESLQRTIDMVVGRKEPGAPGTPAVAVTVLVGKGRVAIEQIGDARARFFRGRATGTGLVVVAQAEQNVRRPAAPLPTPARSRQTPARRDRDNAASAREGGGQVHAPARPA